MPAGLPYRQLTIGSSDYQFLLDLNVLETLRTLEQKPLRNVCCGWSWAFFWAYFKGVGRCRMKGYLPDRADHFRAAAANLAP
jgi:hypothetical protein